MSTEIRAAFEHSLIMAEQGRLLWNRIIVGHGVKDDECVLLFCDGDRASNRIFIKYLKRFLEDKGFSGAFAVGWDREFLEEARQLCVSIRDIAVCRPDEIEGILKLYSLYEFSNRLIVCSVHKPEGRMGELLLNEKYNISMDEIIGVGIYRINNFTAEV